MRNKSLGNTLEGALAKGRGRRGSKGRQELSIIQMKLVNVCLGKI